MWDRDVPKPSGRPHDLTLVCPNLYWLWSMSRDPRSFSAPLRLSMNCPSGMAAGFRMRYLGVGCPRISPGGVVRPLPAPHGPRLLPLAEVPVEDAVGEALAADADALQHPVAAELVHHQGVVHHT